MNKIMKLKIKNNFRSNLTEIENSTLKTSEIIQYFPHFLTLQHRASVFINVWNENYFKLFFYCVEKSPSPTLRGGGE